MKRKVTNKGGRSGVRPLFIKRSRAAKLGWKHRLERVEFDRRSRASKLGWKHRRATATKRSEAAKKGWVTRRKKPGATRKLTLKSADWFGVRDAITADRDKNMQVEFDAFDSSFDGPRESFPLSEINNQITEYLTDEFELESNMSRYWRLEKLFMIERWWDKSKKKFVRIRITVVKGYKKLMKSLLARIAKASKK